MLDYIYYNITQIKSDFKLIIAAATSQAGDNKSRKQAQVATFQASFGNAANIRANFSSLQRSAKR